MEMQPRWPASADRRTPRRAARSDTGARVDAEGGLTASVSEGDAAVRGEEFREAGRLETDRLGMDRLGESALHALSPFRVRAVAEAGGPNITASLFLSLILLVLAFFIVMVSISSFDAERSATVIGSVAGAFSPDVAKSADPVSLGAQRGDVVDGEDFEQSLKRLFATELAIAEFRSVVPGRVLEIEMASEVLFHREQARLRLTRSRLLDRLVATVTMRPVGQRVDVQSLMCTRPSADGDLPTSPSALAVRRAGALGEALIGRGLPRSRLAVGAWPADRDCVVLVFTLAAAQDSSGSDPAALGAAPGVR
jgi:hypothetical protein